MKTTLALFITLALSRALIADDYTVFHVCQDQRVIHTSDGADAGHIEYVVVDPSDHQIVSTIVTGGVIGEKFVALPYESMRFSGDREIVLNDINRERFASAPVIERTQISNTVIQPTVFEKTSQHFGVRYGAGVNINVRDGERRDGAPSGRASSESTQDRKADTANKDQTGRDKADSETRSGNAKESKQGGTKDADAPPSGHAEAGSAHKKGSASQDARAEATNKGDAAKEKGNEEKRQARTGDPDAPPSGRAKPESTEEHGTGHSAAADKEDSGQGRKANSQGKSGSDSEKTEGKPGHKADNAEETRGKTENADEKPQTKSARSTEKTTPEHTAEKATEKSGKAESKTTRKTGKSDDENKR